MIIWFIGFPALVTGLIGVAIAQTVRERTRTRRTGAARVVGQALPSSAACASATVKRRS